jgi:hypothetical protein
MNEINKIGNFGMSTMPNGEIMTFEIRGVEERDNIMGQEYRSIYSRYLDENACVSMDGFYVPIWGDRHNLYPQEVYSIISEHKQLPELLRKQQEFLFGKGLYLYRDQIIGEGKDTQKSRVPVVDDQITAWLDSWESNGLAHPWEYTSNLINDFYHVDTCITKYVFNLSRRTNGRLPVRGLEYISTDTARRAIDHPIIDRRIMDSDPKFILVGDWLVPRFMHYDIYNQFDPQNPFKYNTAIAWVKNKTFSREVYAENNWFRGLMEWIKASNLSPKYINSYLKNALNAHIHVTIPGSWYMKHKEILQDICIQNLQSASPIALEYHGVQLVDPVSNLAIQFYEAMMDQLITNELRTITRFMTGEGKNQGKLWASTKWGDDGWTFEDMPGKFKEYMEAVIEYDKRCDNVIMSGKGIPPSLSNVVPEGSSGTSGNDIYYNYMIYNNLLVLPEYYVLKEFNRALQLNFAQCRGSNGIKIGFLMEIPKKMQDTTPNQRLQSTSGT